MNQRSIVFSLNRKGLTAQVVHDDLVDTLCKKARIYSTVTNYLRPVRIIHRDLTSFSPAVSPHISESDEAILSVLEGLPFSPARQLSHATQTAKSIVYRRFFEKLGFAARHLR
jgi:hypothetical protein